MQNKKYAKRSYHKFNGKKYTFKALPMAILAGLSVFIAPAYAGDTATIESSQKSIDTSSFDYLENNNIQATEPSVNSNNNSYSITEGTQENHVFEYQTVDDDGDVTSKYYNINLLASEAVNLSSSENITWKEVSQNGDNTVTIKLPNNVIKYYQYTYTTPSNYTVTDQRAVNPADDIINVEFNGLSYPHSGAALYQDTKSAPNIIANFINNSTPSLGGAISQTLPLP